MTDLDPWLEEEFLDCMTCGLNKSLSWAK